MMAMSGHEAGCPPAHHTGLLLFSGSEELELLASILNFLGLQQVSSRKPSPYSSSVRTWSDFKRVLGSNRTYASESSSM